MNIYVYLHHPGQFYDSDSKTKIYVNQGKMLFIDLTYELSRVRELSSTLTTMRSYVNLVQYFRTLSEKREICNATRKWTSNSTLALRG